MLIMMEVEMKPEDGKRPDLPFQNTSGKPSPLGNVMSIVIDGHVGYANLRFFRATTKWLTKRGPALPGGGRRGGEGRRTIVRLRQYVSRKPQQGLPPFKIFRVNV
jgi:hypothetical protein